MNITDYGYTELPAQGGTPARVIAARRERYQLVCEHGQVFGRLKAGVYFAGNFTDHPTTGDFVLMEYNPLGDSLITETLPRKSFFSRRDPDRGRGEQAVAANFDYVFVLQSLNQDFNLKRLERYLTAAWQSGGVPVLILTKADLADHSQAQVEAAAAVAPGVAIHPVSALTGEGLAELEPYLLPGKTVVFLGSSGVGKSSLVNALAGEELMAVKEIREDDGRGRHTTTHRQLITLANGGMVIDTPGMRELGMWEVGTGLGGAFADVEQYFGRCRFSDCRHQAEPGCAVLAAIQAGELPPARWQSYQALQREAMYNNDRIAYYKEMQKTHKERTKESRQKSKLGRRQKREK